MPAAVRHVRGARSGGSPSRRRCRSCGSKCCRGKTPGRPGHGSAHAAFSRARKRSTPKRARHCRRSRNLACKARPGSRRSISRSTRSSPIDERDSSEKLLARCSTTPRRRRLGADSASAAASIGSIRTNCTAPSTASAKSSSSYQSARRPRQSARSPSSARGCRARRRCCTNVVRRRVARRGKPYAAKQNVWLLSPQRLICRHDVRRPVGRPRAGDSARGAANESTSSISTISSACITRASAATPASRSPTCSSRSFIRRDVRVLAELTPEAWQALQERDRGLADQFHVLRIAATGDDETRRVMLQVHAATGSASTAASSTSPRCRRSCSCIKATSAMRRFPASRPPSRGNSRRKYAKQPITRAEVNARVPLTRRASRWQAGR